MESFSHPRATIAFDRDRGVVTGFHKRGDTFVSGGGGGTSGTAVAPIHISSTVVVKQDFFLRRNDGVEVPVQIQGQDLPVHDGQDVTAIRGGTGRSKDGQFWLVVINHTARRWWVIEPGMSALDGPLGHRANPVYWSCAAIWIGSLFVPIGGSGLVGLAAAVTYLICKGRAIDRSKRMFRDHLERMARSEVGVAEASS